MYFRLPPSLFDPAIHVAFPKLPSPCLVARAGRKHLPVVTPKSHTRRSVTKVPTFGPRKSVRSTGPVGGVLGALVVNLTCEVRRVAKLPSEPRGDAYQIRQAKYVDSSHSNTRTSQGALGQGVAALQNTLVQKYCEILPYPRPTWSRTIPPTPRTQSATKTFDFQSVQTLRTKLAESVVVPVERENQLFTAKQ